MENWKTITHNQGYQISDYGNVRSIDRTVVGKNGVVQKRQGKQLKAVVDNTGYFVVTLNNNSTSINHTIHSLVATHFVDGYQSAFIVNHKDGNKLNCYYENLEWVTKKYNNQHAVVNELNPLNGETNSQAKLSNTDAKWIRENYIPRHPVYGGKPLAKRFNVCNSTISNIANGTSRKVR